jgi:ABC-type uncharacterized transport system substrate-binding protein
MRRRDLIVPLAAALLRPSIGRAQQPGRVYRLGVVVQGPRRNSAPLFDELRHHGFIEGKNLAIDERGFGIPVERLEEVAAEIVRARPDAIYTGGDAAVVVQRATRTIPVVVTVDDALRAHLVASLAHPGGNITGISILATELDGKRLSLLIALLPGVTRIAALIDPRTTAPQQVAELVAEARSRGVELSIHRAGTEPEIVPAINRARAEGAQALDVLASAMFNARSAEIVAHANALRLPAIYQWPGWVRLGALICYGPSFASVIRQAGALLVKVLKGTKPADIPVEQPTDIVLTINLKTAEALGLTVPPLLLAQADEVIQ